MRQADRFRPFTLLAALSCALSHAQDPAGSAPETACFSGPDVCVGAVEVVPSAGDCGCYRCVGGTTLEVTFCTTDPRRRAELERAARARGAGARVYSDTMLPGPRPAGGPAAVPGAAAGGDPDAGELSGFSAAAQD